jgi:hypothetical protein
MAAGADTGIRHAMIGACLTTAFRRRAENLPRAPFPPAPMRESAIRQTS